MRNSSSFEQRVYDAAASNDATTLQKLLEQMQSQQPAVKRGLLAFKDGDGRTPLMMATAKNHLRCVELLLQHGASVDLMKCKADGKDGTALHEAARNAKTHAAVCDLLLRYGANPFLANPAGRTPLDEAMLAGSFAMMDKMWQKAMWLGTVALKATSDGEYKDRYVAVSQPNRWGDKQIYVRQDTRTLNPMFRGSLSGAKCFWATSTDVLLRMHPVCEPSGDFTTHCERSLMYGKECWCLSLRPVSSSPAAQAGLDTLVTLADPLARRRSQGGSVSPNPAPSGPRPPTPSVSPNPAPSGPRPPTPSFSTNPTSSGSGGGLEGARSPSAAAPMGREQEWMEQLRALPGESDLEFAMRLASAMEVQQQGHGQEGPAQSPPPRAPAPPPLASRPQGASPSAPTLTDEEDSQLSCVVCLSAPRAVGLLHGSTVHKCVCRECAARIKAATMLCPLCRQTVERVLDVFE